MKILIRIPMLFFFARMNPIKIPKYCIKQSTYEIVICKKNWIRLISSYTKSIQKFIWPILRSFEVFLVISQNNWTNSWYETSLTSMRRHATSSGLPKKWSGKHYPSGYRIIEFGNGVSDWKATMPVHRWPCLKVLEYSFLHLISTSI